MASHTPTSMNATIFPTSLTHVTHIQPINNSQLLFVDPQVTIHDPSGPGSAYHTPAPITREEESACTPMAQYLCVGMPSYRPAPDHKSIAFNTQSADHQGIFIHSFFKEDLSKHMQAYDDTPLASMENNDAVLEFYWPGYLRYCIKINIAWRSTVAGRFVRQHASRSFLGQCIAGHAIRFTRMAQWESNMPPPMPLGTTFTAGITTGDLLLQSLDPLISPEGRVVWVPNFIIRYPLGQGHLRHYCQRSRW
ncbi:hypothetical protein B0F90DRAFT_1755275 [Multifurca ochricompacta]|uniref:Uncharacterized protein n=1 Tax=Multifurca ochricompacta TaxID=376703 RepID=A0AAD4M047_9AGAM|nr:hypothetical protein B0F90DRAFT_1755275 [Multifurca ochricompacta]